MKTLVVIVSMLMSVVMLGGCETAEETFTVTFIFNNESTNLVQEIQEGQTISEPLQPSKDGYEFTGWYSDSSLNVPYDFSQGVQGNLNLYAKWNEIIVTHHVIFMDGDTMVTELYIVSGESMTIPQASKDGYTFAGWYLDSALSTVFDIDSAIENDMTMYAKWKEVIETFTIVIYDSYGDILSTQEIEGGDTLDTPEEPTKEGFTFDAWYIDSMYSTPFDFETPITTDISLYAHFVPVYMCGDSIVDPNYFTIGLVTDAGGIDDQSFNQMTWEGIAIFAHQYNIPESNYCYLNSTTDADYEPNILELIENQIDLIVTPGFLFYDVLPELSNEYPNQQFLTIDNVVVAPNVISAVFAEEQQGFIAGVAAAVKAQEAGEDTVGFIGGMDFTLLQQFEAGYEAGVWAVDPTMTVLVDYVGSFSDTALGQALANKQYDLGAYVIFHASGGAGFGIIAEAKERRDDGEDVWVIGVDFDQYNQGIFNGMDSVILTSALKKMDNAVIMIASALMYEDDIISDIVEFDFTMSGVGLPQENPNLSTAQISQIIEYIEEVLDGTITIPLVPSRFQ